MRLSVPEFVVIGKILAPRGVKGKLRVEVITDFPQRFAPRSQVFINRQPVTIDSTEWHKGKAIVKLNTVDDIEKMRLAIFITKRLKLPAYLARM